MSWRCWNRRFKPATNLPRKTDGPDTAGSARARACPVAGDNTSRTRGRCERRSLRNDGNNYDGGVPPASFGVVGSQGSPFSVTQLTSYFHPSPTAGPRTRGSVCSAPGASYKSPSRSLTPVKMCKRPVSNRHNVLSFRARTERLLYCRTYET